MPPENGLKQLIVLSGKGGTGKTSITAALAYSASRSPQPLPAVWVDADVDAANLGLVLQPVIGRDEVFMGGGIALIDPQLCGGCGACEPVCRYDAVLPDDRKPGKLRIDPLACDGCAACLYACPQDAIRMVPQAEGHWYESKTEYGRLFHAELFPGKENTGKLVTLIKQQARLYALDHELPLVAIDGPPGIGCPVISAAAGVNLGLLVTEPTLAAIHDLGRVYQTLKHFKVPAVICINKADIYPQGREAIHAFARQNGIRVIAEIPYDASIPQSMTLGLPVNRHAPASAAARAIEQLWLQLSRELNLAEMA